MRKVGAVVLMAAVLGFAVGGSSNASTERTRFVRLPGRGARPAFVPMSARPTASVLATIRLAGAPVVVRTGETDGAAAAPGGAVDAAARREVLASQQAVTDLVTRLGGEVLYRLTDTANAVVVRVPEDQLDALGAGPGVVAVDQSRQVERDNTATNNYTGASLAWQSLGLTGRGQKIAIIDDGVDYNHADFGGSGNPADTLNDDGLTIGTPNFPSAKVAGGFDFVGDAYDASAKKDDPASVPRPDPDPLSCGAHGTHVAGTAAGTGVTNDGRTYTGPYTPAAVQNLAIGPGAAPEATIYAYKVFGCDGSTSNAIVAAAIDRAVADGVDVISLSLGSPYGSTTSIEAEAVDNAVAAGVTVVASAGNDGANAYLVDTPSSADGAISVAALDASLENFKSGILRLPTEASAIVANKVTLTTVTGTVRIVVDAPTSGTPAPPANPTTIGLGCDVRDYRAVRPGDIVVVKRGTCTRTQKARLAADAGAGAVILVNTQRGLPPYEGTIPGVTVPFLGVQQTVTDALLAANGTALTITAGPDIANGGFGQIATFSAGGPRNGDSAMKPDLAAPGVSILSAAAGTGSGGLLESGTSMAVPHVAGVAALVHQARPSWTPAQVKAALMNTADPTVARIRGINQRVAGTGVVDAVRAVSTAVVATTADGTNALSFGYRPARAGLSPSKTFTITNHGATTATYDLTTEFNGGPGADRGAVVDISPPVVTVAPGASVEVAVTLSMSAATVAKLPGASQPAGSIVLVRGTVTATPREAGLVPLRMPFGLVPRGLSDLRAEITTPLTVTGTTAAGTMDLSNRGIHRGTADVYAWLLSDDVEHDAIRSTVDIRSVGVQTYPGFLLDPSATDDLAIVFAVNVEEAWSTASTGEIDLPIDVNGDGQYDVTMVGADFGAVMNGSDDGRFAAIVFARDGTVLSAFVADAPMNGSTVLLPALASDLGVSATSPAFTVRAQSFDRINKVLDKVPGQARWQPFRPAVSTGDLVDLTAASATTLPVRVDLAAQADQQVLGWLVVTLDDRNGESQADRVPLAGLLPPG